MKSLLLSAVLATLLLQGPGYADPQIGVFPRVNDAGAKASVDSYEAWLGKPVSQIIQFFPGATWNEITGVNGSGLSWWMTQWDGAALQSYRDRMVISVPILPSVPDGSTLAAGATGAYNSKWTTVGQKLVAAGYANATLRLGWEFNGDWYTWNATGGKTGAFRDYWKQIVNTLSTVPGANFKYCFNPTVGDPKGVNPMSAFPTGTTPGGRKYVDIIGLDIYDISNRYKQGYDATGAPATGADVVYTYPNMPAWMLTSVRNNAWNEQQIWGNYHLDWWVTQATNNNLKLCFPEWGLDTPIGTGWTGLGGRDNPVFLQKFHDWTYNVAKRTEWIAYFEAGTGTATRNHAIHFATQYPNAKIKFPQLFGPAPTRAPLADAYVRDGTYAAQNFGTAVNLETKLDGASYARESYLRFDVSGLANAASIKVQLTPTGLGTDQATTTLTFDAMTVDSWTETGITWSNRSTAGSAVTTKTGGFAIGQPFEIDVTAAAKAQASGDGVFTLRIRSTTSGSQKIVTLGSKENTTVANRPLLKYTP